MEQILPPGIAKRLSSWNRVSILARSTQLSLALIGVFCTLAVAAFGDSMSGSLIRGLSFAAALAVGLFAWFDIGAVATRYRQAWQLVNAASIEYQIGILSREALAEAYRLGEIRIGLTNADYLKKTESGEAPPA